MFSNPFNRRKNASGIAVEGVKYSYSNQEEQGSFFTSPVATGRGELRHHNQVLKVIILLLTAALFWTDYTWRIHARDLAEKQWLVFEVSNGQTQVKSSQDFQYGPSIEEIKGQALNLVRWVLTAGSKDVDINFAEAEKLMTQQLKEEFEDEMGRQRGSIKDLNIYRKIEINTIRQMDEQDLLPGSRQKPSRYDVIVIGTLDTYRLSTNEKLATGPFAYHVHTVPLDKRTLNNPSGLLVDSMSPIELQTTKKSNAKDQSNDQAKEKDKGANNEKSEN